jgi:hypothetical protein
MDVNVDVNVNVNVNVFFLSRTESTVSDVILYITPASSQIPSSINRLLKDTLVVV